MKRLIVKYKYIAVILIVFNIGVLYSFTTISRHAEDYSGEAIRIQEETRASSIILVKF